MLHVVTGANGTGKTLLTLKHVKELADREGRPVCYNGRFDLNPSGPLRNWKKIDIQDWQAEPDGTIFFVDEAHNDFPNRQSGAPVPEYVRMLAEHRKRGFDFFLITQHPQNIDVFVRRLVGNPGWHRHLKRVGGQNLVSQLQWDAVNQQCERPGSGESGQVTMVPYPREVFTWYQSAQLHTVKRSIPRPVIVLAVCAVLVPLFAWYGYRSLRATVDPAARESAASTQAGGQVVARESSGQAEQHVATAAEYVQARVARIPGLPYTAPAYDKVTEPTTAPFPAACVLHHKSGECDCYSQQATRLNTPRDVCVQIAKGGVFVDWSLPQASSAHAAPSAPSGLVAAAAPGPAVPVQAPVQAAAAGAAGSGGGGSGSGGGGAGFVEVAQSPVFLSSPGDYTPRIFPALVNEVRPLSDQERRDAAIGAAMHSGDWARH